MSSPQLNYFDGKGRGEIIRMIFAAAGEKYEDRRIKFEDWQKEKTDAPTKALPYIKIDGKIKVGQSMAISRFYAKKFGLHGKNALDELFIDEIVDTAYELLNKGAEAKFSKDEAKLKTFNEETVPKILEILDSEIGSHGKNGFAVGDSMTWADLQILVTIDVVGIPDDVLKKFKRVEAVKSKTESHPKIKAWLSQRPKTSF